MDDVLEDCLVVSGVRLPRPNTLYKLRSQPCRNSEKHLPLRMHIGQIGNRPPIDRIFGSGYALPYTGN